MHVVAVVVSRVGAVVVDPPGDAPLVRAVRVLALVADAVHVLVPPSLTRAVSSACAALPVGVHDDVPDLVASVAAWAHDGQRADTTCGDARLTGGDRRCPGTVLLVHDADRPVSTPLALAVVDAVRAGHPVVVPVLPLTDTVKQVGDDGCVHSTPDRETMRVVQTPQGFRGDLAPRVLSAARDDPGHAWAVAGPAAHTVPGDPAASGDPALPGGPGTSDRVAR